MIAVQHFVHYSYLLLFRALLFSIIFAIKMDFSLVASPQWVNEHWAEEYFEVGIFLRIYHC